MGSKIMCRRSEEVARGVSRLQKEREALEQSVLDMANKTQAMDLWLAENESKIPDGVSKALVITAVWPFLASHLSVFHAVVGVPMILIWTACFIGKQDLFGNEWQAVFTYRQIVKWLLMTRFANDMSELHQFTCKAEEEDVVAISMLLSMPPARSTTCLICLLAQ